MELLVIFTNQKSFHFSKSLCFRNKYSANHIKAANIKATILVAFFICISIIVGVIRNTAQVVFYLKIWRFTKLQSVIKSSCCSGIDYRSKDTIYS